MKRSLIIFTLIVTLVTSQLVFVKPAHAFIHQAAIDTLKSAALATAKMRFLNALQIELVRWIEGGGKPKFISDFGGFLRDVGNVVAGDLIQDIGLGALCGPFNFQLRFALSLPNLYGNAGPRFGQVVTCTLDDVVNNIENFYDDFRTGGFVSFNASWAPQNNFYGGFLLGLEEKNARIASTNGANILEAITGGGYLGGKKCETIGGREFCRVTTPGHLFGEQISKSLGSKVDFIVNAKDIGEFVGVLADAAINRLMREGAEGLFGIEAPPPATFVDRINPCQGLTGRELVRCQNYVRGSLGSGALTPNLLAEEIDSTLFPRLEGELTLKQSINLQANLVRPLLVLNECANINTTQYNNEEFQRIRREFLTEQNQLDRMIREFFVSKSVTAPLEQSRNSIAGPIQGEGVAVVTVNLFDDLRHLIPNRLELELSDLRGHVISAADITLEGGATQQQVDPTAPSYYSNQDVTGATYDFLAVSGLVNEEAAVNFENEKAIENHELLSEIPARRATLDLELANCIGGLRSQFDGGSGAALPAISPDFQDELIRQGATGLFQESGQLEGGFPQFITQ